MKLLLQAKERSGRCGNQLLPYFTNKNIVSGLVTQECLLHPTWTQRQGKKINSDVG